MVRYRETLGLALDGGHPAAPAAWPTLLSEAMRGVRGAPPRSRLPRQTEAVPLCDKVSRAAWPLWFCYFDQPAVRPAVAVSLPVRAEPLGPAAAEQADLEDGAASSRACHNFIIKMAYTTLSRYDDSMKIWYRDAVLSDLADICKFTDWWLAGRGKAKGVTGAVNDYFISPGQHRKYIQKYRTLLALDGLKIVAWAVRQPNRTLIHLLVADTYRNCGIGKMMMLILSPKVVRSKSNQSSGNPIGFYEKLGYRLIQRRKSHSRLDIDKVRPARKSIIDVLKFDPSP